MKTLCVSYVCVDHFYGGFQATWICGILAAFKMTKGCLFQSSAFSKECLIGLRGQAVSHCGNLLA